MEEHGSLTLSIVIPVFNEEESIRPLLASIRSELGARSAAESWEIVVVDDGSRDGSLAVLKGLREEIPELRIVALRRNFGQTAALAAGFDHARGDVIVTMDADGQNDPADIPNLLGKIAEGYDIVSGWRKERKDPWLRRRLPSSVANYLISKVTGVPLRDYGCTLKAYRREVLKDLHLFGEMHRFIPALASWGGVRLTEIPVGHHPRRFGKSKYGLFRTFRVLLDLLTVQFLVNYRARPIQLFGLVGLFCIGSGTLYGLFLLGQRVLFDEYIKPLRPLIVVLLIVTGIQLISLGLLGEMVMRVYFEGQRKPIYKVRERIE